jgi:hypothetical protein
LNNFNSKTTKLYFRKFVRALLQLTDESCTEDMSGGTCLKGPIPSFRQNSTLQYALGRQQRLRGCAASQECKSTGINTQIHMFAR